MRVFIPVLFLNWFELYTPEVPKENLLVLELEVGEEGSLVLVLVLD